jgi:HAD superfamily hydrolase (TIGR01509 family)
MIRAILFDFDGTLTRPGSIDLKGLRKVIGCPDGAVIIEYIMGLEPPDNRERTLRLLDEYERDGARRSIPNNGAEEALRGLMDRGIPLGILTNNTRASVDLAMKSFTSISLADFSVVLTRESACPPKPDPGGVLAAAHALGVDARDLLVVGDYVFDIQAGNTAGSPTALLTNGGPSPEMHVRPNFVVSSLAEIAGVLES